MTKQGDEDTEFITLFPLLVHMYENFQSKKFLKIDYHTDCGEPSKGSECGETKSERCFRKINAATLRRIVGGEEAERQQRQTIQR